MPVYKVLRSGEMADFASEGTTSGAPVDRADGFIHFSAADQLAGTLARHFAGEDGLWLLACDPKALGSALKWEPSRGGALFPHLFRPLTRADLLWVRPLPIGADGHLLPPDLE